VKRYVLLAASCALIAAGCSGESPTGNSESIDTGLSNADFGPATAAVAYKTARAGARNYEVVIENLTPATGAGSSQPFSPPVLATHQNRMHIFEVGAYATDELAGVAEDALNGPLVDRLDGSDRVLEVVTGGGVILPGESARFEVRTEGRYRRLSAVFMLVNTNDGFGGLDGVVLPPHGEKSFYVHAYDAGSELNTELVSDIPGPCCGHPGAGTDTGEPIHKHEGITGVGDLDAATWGWDGAVARITVRRID
jgi:hypothetical protein